ncbi:MAG TPA: DUF4845 domain-containing protein [Burkholderiaceae bacterium]|nr:DUF4845 domain-containing protein [Burkholderiaceae bacterium]
MTPAATLSMRPQQRGVTLLGLVFWAVVVAFTALIVMKVLPTVNEFYTIQRAVNKVAKEGGTTVPEIRNAFERQKQIEYSISSISASDLEITKVNDKIVLRFAYNKEIELFDPVFLLIKYHGESK